MIRVRSGGKLDSRLRGNDVTLSADDLWIFGNVTDHSSILGSWSLRAEIVVDSKIAN